MFMLTNGAVLFIADLRHGATANAFLSSILGHRVSAQTFASLDSTATGYSAGVPW